MLSWKKFIEMVLFQDFANPVIKVIGKALIIITILAGIVVYNKIF